MACWPHLVFVKVNGRLCYLWRAVRTIDPAPYAELDLDAGAVLAIEGDGAKTGSALGRRRPSLSRALSTS